MKIVVSSNFYAFVLLSFHLQYIPCQCTLSNFPVVLWISLVIETPLRETNVHLYSKGL
jgi:hypothetical protein